MCGVCGILLNDRSARVDPARLHAMCGSIAHRGPDDEGIHVAGPIALGVRRLSIIDVEGGHQPITSENGSTTVVYNGEIYNFRELHSELTALGHSFATRTDTEVIVHGYEEWGVEVVRRLRGMFAFLVWDAEREELFAAVDRFGIKPLYWAMPPEGLVLGSELRCLLASGLVPREIDTAALAEYFALGYVSWPRSILADVHKLGPGTRLRWSAGREPALDRYWEPPSPSWETLPVDDVRASVLDALRDAVRAHLVSDVPLGAFLSGGIDSSVVVGLMAEATSGPVKTFSIGFHDPEHDELGKARLVASHFGTDHHELVVEPASADVLPTLVSHFGEPFADSSALPTYHVSRLAASSVKVALSGDGGDELFVGYTTFRGVELSRRLQPIPASVRRSLAWAAARPPRIGSAAWNDRVGRFAKRAQDSLADPGEAYRSKVALTDPEAIAGVLGSTLREAIGAENPFVAIDESLASSANGADPLERYLRVNLDVSLHSDMLVKVDRMSMANSLEVRVPMLDHALAELVLGLPVRTRFPRWRLKGLLRDSVRGLLPPEILRQRKHGFTVPVARWFRSDLSAFARDVLLDDVTARRGFVDTRRLEAAVEQHGAGRRDLGSAIWSLLIFELWCREVLD